ncbi:MAG: hypothetical protein BZY82_09070 [SAR202 cluster bacterium Io17-Chloro-G3]|nr:MAG: hypothetical protein BZY82_09070 [SAR202 cluster bacterium Io17-Chloro-G3]
MVDLRLTFAMAHPNDRVLPLFTGEVKPEGIALQCIDAQGVDMFYDQLKFNRYDVSEMSFSSFLRARAQGWGYVALPIFQVRAFQYTKTIVRVDAGIQKPRDLRGKRVGTAEYQLSSSLWTRGILQHEFGVHPEEMVWFIERSERYSHGGASNFNPPPGVKLHYTNTDFGTMFLQGELDAAFSYFPGSRIDRPKLDLSQDKRFSTLFTNYQEEASRFYRKHHIFPIHHLTVVRENVVKQYPWVATSLINGFQKAKEIALQHLYEQPPTLLMFGRQLLEAQRAVFGDDPYQYGIKANAKEIDLIRRYSMEQGLTKQEQSLEELFPEEVLIAEENSSAKAL